MTLGDLLAGLVTPALLSAPPITTTPSAPVTTVTYDSRRVTPGTVFVALRGLKADGAQFAPQAVARGAVAVVAETETRSPSPVPWVVVPDARLALALLADRLHGHPSGELKVVGITGTNGKDDDGVFAAVDFRSRRHALRPAWNRRLQPRTAGH